MHIISFGSDIESNLEIEGISTLDSPNTLVTVFASPQFSKNQTQILEIISKFPRSKIIGCSTSGEIFGDMLADQSLSVAIAKFERTQLRSAFRKLSGPEASFSVGQSLALDLRSEDLRSVFVLSDGLDVNGSELVRGLHETLGSDVVITGGLAGDGDQFGKTFVINNEGLRSGSVCAVGFYGDHVKVSHGSKGGWDRFGHERAITRSAGNILYELDGKPALDIYKQYLGDKVNDLPASALFFPLAVRNDQDSETTLVRTILSINEEDNSLVFAGDVPEGGIAQFLYANLDRLIAGASDAGNRTNIEPDKEVLTIGISCVGRRLVLGDRTDEELTAVLETMPEKTHFVGFYSYGEISPHSSGSCELLNQTMTLTTFQEAA